MIEINNGHYYIIDNSTLSSAQMPKIIILPGSLSQNSVSSPILTGSVNNNDNNNNTKNGSHYEIMLPVIFIILFIMILFFIYALTNLELKKKLKRTCCCFNHNLSFKNNSNTLIYQQNRIPTGLAPRLGYQSNMLRRSLVTNNDLNYYEDTNTGFYRLQKNIFDNQKPANIILNHNYDQIYSTTTVNHPSEMMMAIQGRYKLNKLYKSEDTGDYNISYEKETDRTYYDNQYYSYLNQANIPIKQKSISIDIDTDHSKTDLNSNIQQKKESTVRRSYSNSRVDNSKWRSNLLARPANINNNNNTMWQSNIQNMTEFELKRFLNQEDLSKSNKSNNIQILRNNYSESILDINVDQSRANVINKLYYHFIQNETNSKYQKQETNNNNNNNNNRPVYFDSHVSHLSSSSSSNYIQHQAVTHNSLSSSYTSNSTSVQITESSSSNNYKSTILKNGISYNDQPTSENNTNINSLCIDSQEVEEQTTNNMKNENEIIHQYPSIFSFNCSEINNSTIASDPKHINNSLKKQQEYNKSNQLRYRSSTFKAINNLVKQDSIRNIKQKENTFTKIGNKLKELSNENLIKAIYKELKFSNSNSSSSQSQQKSSINNILSLFSIKSTLNSESTNNNKTKTNLNKKYSRLCKSFTFVSSDNNNNNLDDNHDLDVCSNLQKNNNETKVGTNNEKMNIFLSEPTKLSTFTVSSSNNKAVNNYLKNINKLKSKIGESQLSLSSIMDKVSEVANMNQNKFKLLKQQDNYTTSPYTKDVSVQTSSILTTNTDSSSINSNGATVQSNTFGSIVAHFGSASIQKKQSSSGYQSKRILFRANSDGYCLSNTNYTKPNQKSFGRDVNKNNLTCPKLVDLSIQF